MEPKHAREDLHYIRQIMSQVSPPLSMSGWMGVGWGVVFFTGGIVTHIAQFVSKASFGSSLLIYFWIVLLLIGSVSEIFFSVRKCLSAGLPVFTKHIGYLYLGFTANILAGFSVQMIFSHLGEYFYIPGAWMLIFGSGSILFGLFASKELAILGIIYMAGGVLAVWPFVQGSFLVLALFVGMGTFLWGLWVNRRLGG